MPPPPGVANPIDWGEERIAEQRFGSRAHVSTTRRSIIFDLPFGPHQAEEHFRRHIGPAQIAFSRLDSTGQQQLAAALKEHWVNDNRSTDDGRTLVHTEYLEVHARPK